MLYIAGLLSCSPGMFPFCSLNGVIYTHQPTFCHQKCRFNSFSQTFSRLRVPWGLAPKPSRHHIDVNATSTSHRRRYIVIFTLCACWEQPTNQYLTVANPDSLDKQYANSGEYGSYAIHSLLNQLLCLFGYKTGFIPLLND